MDCFQFCSFYAKEAWEIPIRFLIAVHGGNVNVFTVGKKRLFLSPGDEESLGGW